MRKLLPFFLAFAIVVCFAACKDKNDPSSPAISTSAPSGSNLSSSSNNVTVDNPSAENVAQTYILTTTPDMTVPSVATTQFNPANEAASTDPFTTQTVTTDFNLTVASITTPVVNSTALPSVPTAASTTASSTSSGKESKQESTSSEKTTTKKESTTSAEAKAVNILDAGVGLDGSGKKIIYSIDPSCGNFKSNSTVITVTVDGEEFDNIPCKISASNIDASGCQQITIDLSGVESLESGSTVSFSVPEAFLNSKDGKTYSRSFGNTIVV